MSCCDTISDINIQLRINNVELMYKELDLLAEVKRLREELRLTKEWLDQLHDEELVSAFRYHVYGED